jgi:hypothetical protein
MSNKTESERKMALLTCLQTMRLEQAVTIMRETPICLEQSDYEDILSPMTERLRRSRQSGLSGTAARWFRRIRAIQGFRDCGPDPMRMIASVELPEGYDGKILLVNLAGGVVEKMVCLRSGDDWHRSILANTRQEILDLGFDGCIVHELGGASVSFEASGTITIWGASDDFGACDKDAAAALIAEVHPGRQIIIAD